jgi:hypothetical protein
MTPNQTCEPHAPCCKAHHFRSTLPAAPNQSLYGPQVEPVFAANFSNQSIEFNVNLGAQTDGGVSPCCDSLISRRASARKSFN